MKLLTHLSIVAAAIAVLGSSAAMADDSQLQNRLAIQNGQNSPQISSSTVALYSTRNGISSAATPAERSDVRFQLRPNNHGQFAGSFESVR
jgi:hypothetical protein